MRKGLAAVLLSVVVVSCSAVHRYQASPLRARLNLQHALHHRFNPQPAQTSSSMNSAFGSSTKAVNKAVSNSRFTLTGASGILGLVLVIASGIARLLPVALQPFLLGMNSWQWSLYAVTVVLFAYGEGYRAFQRGYAPMVVARSLTLPGRHILVRVLLATPYCMGLFHATRKRLLTSWGVFVGVNLLIVAIKYLPYPYRSIVDAGAVVGLLWGVSSILIIWVRVVFFGASSTADPCLPVTKKLL